MHYISVDYDFGSISFPIGGDINYNIVKRSSNLRQLVKLTIDIPLVIILVWSNFHDVFFAIFFFVISNKKLLGIHTVDPSCNGRKNIHLINMRQMKKDV